MNVDNLCKHLAETYPDSFAAWLLGTPIDDLGSVEVIKTELGAEPIRADFVALVRGAAKILHVEFQLTVPPPNATPLGLRMLDYWVRLHRKYRLPLHQVLVLIKPTSVPTPGVYEADRTRHEFDVVRLWELDPAPLLANEALLPLAVLARAEDRTGLLSTVADRVRRIEPQARRSEISSIVQILAGLVANREVIRTMFGENILKESVVYQEIIEEGLREGRATGLAEGLAEGKAEGLAEGLAEGKAEGLAEGLAEGKAEGLAEGARLSLLAVLESRFGAVPDDVRVTLDHCPLDVLRQLAAVAGTCPTMEAFGQAAVAPRA